MMDAKNAEPISIEAAKEYVDKYVSRRFAEVSVAFVTTLYQALREDQEGLLPKSNVRVGALDQRRSDIMRRVEAMLGMERHAAN